MTSEVYGTKSRGRGGKKRVIRSIEVRETSLKKVVYRDKVITSEKRRDDEHNESSPAGIERRAENHGGDNHEEQASEQRVTQGEGSPAEHERRAEIRA